LIGCGERGREVLRFFVEQPDVDCLAVCDVDDAQIERAAKVVQRVSRKTPEKMKDFRRVLDRKDVDACLIATPDHWHALPAVNACQAGKDVYLEKPMALTLAEEQAIATAVRKHARVFQLGTQWRSGAHYQEAISQVRAGRLGNIRHVRCWCFLDWVVSLGKPPDSDPPMGVDYDFWLGPSPRRPFNANRFHFNFRWFWDYGGGLMTDWGVHMFNLVYWALGPAPPASVVAVGGKYSMDDNTETPDTLTVTYEYPDHTVTWEHLANTSLTLYNRPTGVAFVGSEGCLIVGDGGYQIVPGKAKYQLEPHEFVVEKISEAKSEGGQAHVRNFLDCVRSRAETVSNINIGSLASATAHLGNIALRSASRIKWDAAAGKVIGSDAAVQLCSRKYREPWSLPYMKV
jgi:predicted dehydrogenase